MANYRATKSGINADVQKKLAANYPYQEEDRVREWIGQVTEKKIEGPFFDAVKDGTKLCQLLNCLQPGLVPAKHEKPSDSKFKKLETVGAFLKGCKDYGMAEEDLFVTVDLFELQNKNMVISTLVSLGRQAQKKGYEGHVIGPKEAERNEREFSEQQKQEGKNVIGLQMGTNQVANQKGMTPYGHSRQIADTRIV